MIRTQDTLTGSEGVTVQLGRLQITPKTPQGEGEVAAAAQGVGVIRTQDTLTGGEGVTVQLGRLQITPKTPQGEGEVVAAAQGGGMVGAEGAFLGGEYGLAQAELASRSACGVQCPGEIGEGVAGVGEGL